MKTLPATPREAFEDCKPYHEHAAHLIQEVFAPGNILQTGGVLAVGQLDMAYKKIPTVKLVAVWTTRTDKPVFTPLGFTN